MSAVNSNLNSCTLISRLQQTARPFPQSSTTSNTICHVPTGVSDVRRTTSAFAPTMARPAVPAWQMPRRRWRRRCDPWPQLRASVSANQPPTFDARQQAANASISSAPGPISAGAALAIQNASSAKATVTARAVELGPCKDRHRQRGAQRQRTGRHHALISEQHRSGDRVRSGHLQPGQAVGAGAGLPDPGESAGGWIGAIFHCRCRQQLEH